MSEPDETTPEPDPNQGVLFDIAAVPDAHCDPLLELFGAYELLS